MTVAASHPVPGMADPVREPIAFPSTAPTAEDWQRQEDQVFLGCSRTAALFVMIGVAFVGLFNWGIAIFPAVVTYGGLAISLLASLVGLIGTIGARTNEQITKRGIFCYATAVVGIFTALPAIYQACLALAGR